MAKLGIMATGGMDSTLLLYEAANFESAKFDDVVLYYAFYGQAVAPIELENVNRNAVQAFGRQRNIRVRIVDMTYHNIARNMLLSNRPRPTAVHDQDDPEYYKRQEMLYHDTHIEGRNGIMVLTIASVCMTDKVDELWAGYKFTAEDWKNCRSYKLATADNGPDFVDAMNSALKYGYSRPLRFRAPLMERRLDKSDVLHWLRYYNVDVENNTYSCYYPKPCGKCDNCLLRAKM